MMDAACFSFYNPESYIRVQTCYYKRCRQPTIQGDYSELWVPWSTDTLKQDLRGSQIKKIRKFDGFCCVPSHLEYVETIGNFYNVYHPLDWKPEDGPCPQTLAFLRHIFGEQYELGLDFLTLLYRKPTQQLPVLCLVSRERKTGKTTFLNLLKQIFGRNVTFNGNSDFRSQFNSDWMHTLVIAVDEVLLGRKEDSEKIKNLSTAKTAKIEAKGKDRRETEFFGKFILCSNNEENFIIIEPTETRYWVRKVPVFEKENIHLLKQMKEEIPRFLNYLLLRPLSVPHGLSRMWFSEKQLRTNALLRVMRNHRNKIETELLFLLKDLFDASGADKLYYTIKDLFEMLRRSQPNILRQQISNLLQNEWGLLPAPNSLSYQTFFFNAQNELVPVRLTGRYFTILQVWAMARFDDER